MIRFLLFSFFCWSLSSGAFAEYNGHFIDFNIELTNGKVIKGHTYLASIEYMVDSGDYKSYLERRFDVLIKVEQSDECDDYAYHEYRLTYKYQVPEFDSAIIYTLTNKKSIDIHKVKRVEITKMIDFGYTSGIVNSLNEKDEKWMNKSSIEYWGIGDELNSFHVFIHEKSNKLIKVLAEIDEETNRFYAQVKALEEEIDSTEWSERKEPEEQLRILEENRAEQVSNAISKLFDFKVVIVGYFSC